MATKSKVAKKAAATTVTFKLDKQEQDLINKFRAFKAAVAKERQVENNPDSYDLYEQIDDMLSDIRYS